MAKAKFKPIAKNHYLEYDPFLKEFRVKKLFGHRTFAADTITAYRLTMDDALVTQSDGHSKALILNSLFTDAGIMGITTPGTKEIYALTLTIETTGRPVTVKFINTRTEVGTLVYSVGLLDAEKALQQLDALR